MHWYTARNGLRRLWIEDDEFDAFTEQELRRANLYPTVEEPAVDIERFIQRHQRATLDQYADLGDGLAGAIEFWPDRFKISISRRLTEQADEIDCEPGIRGRWRATMAHESAHGLFHREIYQSNPAQESLAGLLFDEPQAACQSIQCLEQEVVFGGGLDWREFRRTGAWPRCSCRAPSLSRLFGSKLAKLRKDADLSYPRRGSTLCWCVTSLICSRFHGRPPPSVCARWMTPSAWGSHGLEQTPRADSSVKCSQFGVHRVQWR